MSDDKPLDRQNITSGTRWEALAGYSRAVRVGDRVYVSGTTATDDDGQIVGAEAYEQSVFIFQKIERALEAAGESLADVVRTRIYVTDISQWEGPARAHAQFFAAVRPANTLVAVAALVGEGYLVEIEAEAIIGARA